MTTTALEALARFVKYQDPKDAKVLNKFDIKDFLFSVQRKLETAAEVVTGQVTRPARIMVWKFTDVGNISARFCITTKSTDTVGDLKQHLAYETKIPTSEMVLEYVGHSFGGKKDGSINDIDTSLYNFFRMEAVPIEFDDRYDFSYGVVIFPTLTAKWIGEEFNLCVLLYIRDYLSEFYIVNVTRDSTAKEVIAAALSQVENLPTIRHTSLTVKGRGDKSVITLRSDDVIWEKWIDRRSRICIFAIPETYPHRVPYRKKRHLDLPTEAIPNSNVDQVSAEAPREKTADANFSNTFPVPLL